jgi:glycosyltransferase involved in cell wall biosynthesis
MLFNGVYVLWPDPLIVSCLGHAETIAALRIPKSADVIVHPTWLPTMRSLPQLFRHRVRAAQSGKRVHFMCDAESTNRLLRRFGFPGELVAISGYINEHKYRITGAAKSYDAVYAARMAPYKRLHLAAKVPSLFVQTYGDCRTADGAYDLHAYEPRIRHCDFNREWVPEDEVVNIYNRGRVGLALSEREGAMLASVEYMLCGLSLVSTRCSGGREQFFDDRYVSVVDPTPEAVAAGVQALLDRSVDPQLVRTETLRKLQQHRERLCDYIVGIIQRRGRAAPARTAVMSRLFDNAEGARRWFVHSRDFPKHGLA